MADPHDLIVGQEARRNRPSVAGRSPIWLAKPIAPGDYPFACMTAYFTFEYSSNIFATPASSAEPGWITTR